MCRPVLDQLRRAAPGILPSLLLCDFGNLAAEVRRLEEASVPALHLDVMDGHFVPNLTYGMPIVAAIRKLTKLPLDVHLMITNPDRYVESFAAAGADLLTVHVEALENPPATAQRIRNAGLSAGLALNPATSLETVWPHLAEWDLILVMSVPAGFGGQSFQPIALEKLRALRQRVSETTLLEVDGGVNAATIASCAQAGSQLHVVGSAIFQSPDYTAAVQGLRDSAIGHSSTSGR